MIDLLRKIYGNPSQLVSKVNFLKFLVTNRPYKEIEDDFQRTGPKILIVRLYGELENDKIHDEINVIVREKVATLAVKNNLSPKMTGKLRQKLLSMKHGTYLWLHLAIEDIENNFQDNLQPNLKSIESMLLPASVEDAYEKILMKVPKS